MAEPGGGGSGGRRRVRRRGGRGRRKENAGVLVKRLLSEDELLTLSQGTAEDVYKLVDENEDKFVNSFKHDQYCSKSLSLKKLIKLLYLLTTYTEDPGTVARIMAEVFCGDNALFLMCIYRFLSGGMTMVEPDTIGNLVEIGTVAIRRIPSVVIKSFPVASLQQTLADLAQLGKSTDEMSGKFKVMCELFSTQKAQAVKDKVEKVKREKASKESEGDPPEIIAELSILPKVDEMHVRPSEVFLRKNKIKGGYDSWEHYFDVQFRLLREDFIRPLRKGITDHCYYNGPSQRPSEIRVYEGARVLNPVCLFTGICFQLRFDTSKLRHVMWDYSKRLIYGSLLCLSNDRFNQCFIFATVQQSEPKLLKQGLLTVRFENGANAFQIDPNDTYMMVESTAYYEAYRHILKGLQELSTHHVMPMQKCIVDVDFSEIRAPAFLRIRTRPPYFRMADVLQKKDPGERVASPLPRDVFDVTNDRLWPDVHHTHLDESQLRALKMALSTEVSIIQGPPGTGKTYIGLKIVEAYLKNRDVWDPQKEAPILVVCFTNHALDQFLEGIKELSLDASDEVHPDIIRVGGRCKSEKLADCALNKRVRAQKSQKKIPQDVFKPYKEALSSLLREKDAIDALMENSNFEFKAKIIRLPTLQPVIDPKHVEQLRNPRESETVEGKEVDVWLGIWFAETEEDIETEAPLASANQPQQASTLQVNQPLTVPAEELSESSSDEDDLIAVDNQARLITEDRMIEGEEIALPEAQQLKKKYLSADPGIPKKETAHSADAEDPQRKAEGKSEWKTVQMSRRVQMRKIISGCCHNVPMAPREAASVRDVWSLKLQKRWRLYLYWKNEYIKLCKERVNDRATAYNDLCANYHQKQQEIDCHCSRSADVIGMTTTGAAKYRHLLQGVHPKIVIFEEAAEVLEAHVITSLASSVQQLILIGDHKQLRPKPTCYDLEKDYNLDISLFERLINNGFKHVTLEIQHRMRPEVSKLICPIIYNTLYDADNVKTYPHVMGVGKDVFFIDHTEPEEHNRSSDTKSHVNKYEVQYIVQLCHYLLKQGYAPQEITILTMYTGQLLEFRRQMKREIFEGVRVAAVDDFQGEENEIILLSLVRSNPENNIGFLRIENRVCVSLSRAKQGLYVIGNLKMLHDKHHTKWPEIIHHLEEVNAVGPALPLYCQVHQDDKIEAQVPSDFEKRPEGGCSKPCGARLPCGHVCERKCHPTDREHALTKCKKICGKILPSCGHNCRRKCHECSDQENKQCLPCSELVLKKLLCGHELMLRCAADPFGVLCPMICKKTLPCLHSCKNACSVKCATQCREKVLKLLPCGHNTMVSCYKDPENARCPEECGTTLQCGHVCGGTCGKCQHGRLHVKCSIKCGRKLVCGHNCDYPCASICLPCTNSCNNFCSHGRCPKKCYELCTPCTKPCDWQCPHYGCTKPCGQPCDRPACNYQCYKMLKCGHPCIGLCGEKCPDKCRICNKDEVCKIFFGKEDEDNASFIQLQDCDHIFEVSEFDKWMRISNSRQVQFKVCPKCATPVVNSLRYGNTIKETWRDIEAIKRKQIQAVGDLNLHQRCREVERELLRLVGADYSSEDIDVIKKRIPTEHNTFSLFRAKTAEFQLSTLPKLVKLHKIIKNIHPNVSASKCSPNYLQEHSSTLKRFLMKEFLSLQQMSDCVSEFRRLTCATKLLDLLSKMQAKKCHVSSVDHDSIIKELERAYLSGWKNQALTEVQEDQVNNMICRLNIKYGVDGLSYRDNPTIVSSIGLSNGNWFKCPRGHYYCVGTSKRVNPLIRSSTACPECSSTIGRSLTPAATL